MRTPGSLTMTFGVSVNDSSNWMDSLHKADEALYEGKRQGKNCVRVYPEA